MKTTMGKKGLTCFFALLVSLLLAGPVSAAVVGGGLSETLPLSPDTAYTITLQRLTSTGTLQTLETTTGTTDADAVLSFTLTNVPTKDEANFIILTVTDNTGAVVRKGVAPAPPPGDNNATGLNYLSTKQADALIRAAEIVGTDDPIVAAYLFIILRTPNLTADDIENIAQLGVDALTATNLGFESFLLSHGVSAAQLDSLKGCLIYNPDPTAKTLRDFGRNFFNAVEAATEAQASEEMQKAGGFVAEIFLDAAACSGVDPGKILAAHNAAGDGADAGGHMALLPNGVLSSIETAMTTFNRRIAIVRITEDYTNALTALGASGAHVTQFLDGVNAMMTAQATIDTRFSLYYMDREAYLAGNSEGFSTDEQVRTAMDNAYSTVWTQFQSAIAASDGDIAAMIAQIQNANPGLMLPPDFGGWWDQNGNRVNWPVTQVVLMNWMADTTFNYGPRDTTPIPQSMEQWMGSCDNTMYWDKASCDSNLGLGHWTPGRHDFEETQSAVFRAYLGLQEDLNILQMQRNELWQTNPNATGAERAANEETYVTAVQAARDRISGNKGGAAITAEQKDAIVKLLQPPQM
ncbi:MAG: hypothetical protein AB1346_04935 [Thermodesulfobacteriota bacterium]